MAYCHFPEKSHPAADRQGAKDNNKRKSPKGKGERMFLCINFDFYNQNRIFVTVPTPSLFLAPGGIVGYKKHFIGAAPKFCERRREA